MRTALSSPARLFAAFLALTCATFAADTSKPKKITLEDVIFDVTYLKENLGPNTLVTAVVETSRGRTKTDTALADAIQAVQDLQLNAKSQIFALPDDAIQPQPKISSPHTYPPGLQISREAKTADFLVIIGADGAVKCLYCYKHNDRLFALAAAMAVVKWRYEPARIHGTAVPVLAGLPMKYEISDVNALTYRNTLKRHMDRGLPIRPIPVIVTPNPPPVR